MLSRGTCDTSICVVPPLLTKGGRCRSDIIRTTSKVVWTSPRTVGVHVTSCRLSRSEWVGEEICSGFFFMVAIDENMEPVQIPQFEPKTDDEKEMWSMANEARNAMR